MAAAALSSSGLRKQGSAGAGKTLVNDLERCWKGAGDDLVGRKTVRDGGAVAKALCARIEATEQELLASGQEDGLVMAAALQQGRLALEATVDYLVANARTQVKPVYAGAVNYLRLAGLVLGGWHLLGVIRHRRRARWHREVQSLFH